MIVSLDPEAAEELRHARRWYAAEASVVVARRFIVEFERLKKLLSQQPLRSPEIEPGVRRLLFRDRFPYALVYVIRSSRVVIVAVMHQHREPGYWRERIGG